MGLLDWIFGKPTLATLAREVVRWLQAQGATDVEVNLEMSEVSAKVNGAPCSMFLGNLHHEYARAPRAGRQAVIERFLAGVVTQAPELPETYEEIRPQLLPVVRNAASLGVARLSGERMRKGGDDLDPAARPLVADLCVAIVVDMPTAMSYLHASRLAKWGKIFDEVLADALDNLRGLPEHGGWKAFGPGVWSGEWGDSYESSRLLLPDLVYRLGITNPVLMVPFRNALLVTSAENAAGIEAMYGLARQSLEANNRWLSFRLLALQGPHLVEHERPAPVEADYRFLQLNNDAAAYASQKDLLDALHGANGTDIFVATFGVMQGEGEAPCSYAVWSDGVDTLLPVVERVLFYRRVGEEQQHAAWPWSRVCEQFGDLMEPTEHHPPRFRVRGFPAWEVLTIATPEPPLHP
jgi:hypothetical protein